MGADSAHASSATRLLSLALRDGRALSGCGYQPLNEQRVHHPHLRSARSAGCQETGSSSATEASPSNARVHLENTAILSDAFRLDSWKLASRRWATQTDLLREGAQEAVWSEEVGGLAIETSNPPRGESSRIVRGRST